MKQLAVLQKDSANQCTVYLSLIFFYKICFFLPLFLSLSIFFCFWCFLSFVMSLYLARLCFLSLGLSLWLCLCLCHLFFFVTLNNELFRNDKEIKQENTSPCYRPTSPRFTDQETKRDLSPLSTHRLLYLYLNPYHIEPNKVEIGKEGMWQGKIISAGLFSIS